MILSSLSKHKRAFFIPILFIKKELFIYFLDKPPFQGAGIKNEMKKFLLFGYHYVMVVKGLAHPLFMNLPDLLNVMFLPLLYLKPDRCDFMGQAGACKSAKYIDYVNRGILFFFHGNSFLWLTSESYTYIAHISIAE